MRRWSDTDRSGQRPENQDSCWCGLMKTRWCLGLTEVVYRGLRLIVIVIRIGQEKMLLMECDDESCRTDEVKDEMRRMDG